MTVASLKYRPEIDGLRAVAILPVVLYHAGIAGFPGGFVGVDVFFVISGYLITSIILGEREAGRFTLSGFYNRRIRRIFPALFVMMALSYPVAFALLGPSAMKEFTGSLTAATVSFANVYLLHVSGYFATAAEVKPLLHTWSLAVEEQFYLVFPTAVLLTWRAGPKVQAALFFAVALISLGVAQWNIAVGEGARAFFLLHTRIWELMAGVMCAYWLKSARGQALRESGRLAPAALIGLGMILFAVATYSKDTPFPGVAALLPCLGAALVIAFATPRSLAGMLLGWRPVVFVGLVSYSFYLWHVPLLVFTRIGTGHDDPGLMFVVCVLAFGMACLSWRFVEIPVRHMRGLPPLKLFGAAALGIVLLGGAGLAGMRTEGFRDYYLRHRMDAVARANYEKYEPQTRAARPPNDRCRFDAKTLDADFVTRFESCARDHGKALVVLGDSHAGNIFEALLSTQDFPFLVTLWHGGCRPYRNKPECPYQPFVPFLKAHAGSVSKVVFHITGAHYILDHRGQDDSDAAYVAGNPTRFTPQNISATLDYLDTLSTVSPIIWLGPFAEARVDLRNPANYSPGRLRFNRKSLDLYARLDQMIAGQAETRSGIRYISLVGALRFNRESLLQDGCITFKDQDHLSLCGARLVGPKIAALLKDAGAVRKQALK